MQCIFCKSKYPCVKNGTDRKGIQRYKCQDCKKTFTNVTRLNLKVSNNKRLVLHLILAGCELTEIAERLEIPQRVVKGWKKLHLKEVNEILPVQPLLSTHTLSVIYKAIEKKRIAAINIIKRRRFR
jgi:transposase-like protein